MKFVTFSESLFKNPNLAKDLPLIVSLIRRKDEPVRIKETAEETGLEPLEVLERLRTLLKADAIRRRWLPLPEGARFAPLTYDVSQFISVGTIDVPEVYHSREIDGFRPGLEGAR